MLSQVITYTDELHLAAHGSPFLTLTMCGFVTCHYHGAIVPRESKVQKQGDESPAFLLRVSQSLITFLCFEIFTRIPRWKFKVIQNKLLIVG